MGSTWSSGRFFSSSPSTLHLDIEGVLALCEDGDLLLAREKLADSALRVGVEFVVARDIQRMQRGQFPAQRVTSLPPWTSCELLLRHEGVLHVVVIGANGLQFIPFEERVAGKMPHIHDRFAARRLRYDARTEALSATLRDLATQVASVAPISWQTLLFPTARTTMSPRSPQQQLVDRETIASALKELPPRVRQLLVRMLELFCQGLKLGDASTASQPIDQPDDKLTPPLTDKNLDASKAGNEFVTDELHAALGTLGLAEVTSRLSAAFVTAVYELVHLLDPITADRSELLTPAALWSSCNDPGRLVFTPPTALGTEMAVTRPKAHSSDQKTYSLAK